MTFGLVYHHLIAEDVARFNRDVRWRLAKAIGDRLGSRPESYGKPLKGNLAGYWALRVGDYRVVYKIVKREVWIYAVIHRKDVYDVVMKRLSWSASAEA